MSNQTKNAQPSPSDKEPKNAGGIDDIDEGQDRVENEDVENEFEEGQKRFGQDDARRAGGRRGSESETPDSPDSRPESERTS
jgi:hypothetical protein